MLSKVWLLGPHKTYTALCPKPWPGGLAGLGSARLGLARLGWQRSPRASAQTLSQGPGTARTALSSRG